MFRVEGLKVEGLTVRLHSFQCRNSLSCDPAAAHRVPRGCLEDGR